MSFRGFRSHCDSLKWYIYRVNNTYGVCFLVKEERSAYYKWGGVAKIGEGVP